jgi:hypothetical protein
MGRIFNKILCSATILAAVTQIGCGQQTETESATPAAPGTSELGAFIPMPTLHTFINDSIQIDQFSSSLAAPDDANLFVGPDPADGTASVDKPTGPGTFIDWEDLRAKVDNHRVLDLNNSLGVDPNSFPHSNECVGPSNVLKKMDLTYVAAANNNVWAYLAVQRSANNGDAGYYWLFTKLRPQMHAEQFPCGMGETRLLYDISPGDVLIAGHFHPNGTPLLHVYRATRSVAAVPAPDAINFQSATWQEDPTAVGAAAVNMTITAPGSLGSAGVISMDGGNLGPEIFAEVAVPISLFFGAGESKCDGATMYGSVITRSSGSGGTSPDLKDLAGPAIFNFFTGTKATAELRPSCSLDVSFEVTSVVAGDGSPVVDPTCTWTFDDGATATGCSGVQEFAAGSHSAQVTVTDPATGCTETVTTAPITVYAPLSVTADLAGTCDGSFTYSADASGGSGAFSYAWSFGGGAVTPASSTDRTGSVTVEAGGTYSGTVFVTDARPDGLSCTATVSDETQAFKTSASAEVRATCTLDVNFALTSASGLDGTSIADPICVWTFDDGSTATGCSGVQALAPGSRAGTVTVTDPSSGCSATVTTEPVSVYPPLSVVADLVGSCDGSFSYSAVGSGGSGSFSYLWSFAGGGSITPSSVSEATGSATVGAPGVAYSGTVSLTDVRADGSSCSAAASDETMVFTPLRVSLALSGPGQACPAMANDGVQYQAVVSGGSGNYTMVWNGAACSGATCVINPADGTFCDSQSFSVTVTDDTGLCAPVTSETESYSKVTMVNATDN